MACVHTVHPHASTCQPGRSEAQWQITPEFDVLSSFFTAQAQHRLFTGDVGMVLGPRIRQLHSPGGVINDKAIFWGVHELLRTSAKTPGVRFLIIKKVTENARCPFFYY